MTTGHTSKTRVGLLGAGLGRFRQIGLGVAVGALIAMPETARAAGEMLLHQEIVPVAPLARVSVPQQGEGKAQTVAMANAAPLLLPLPSGDVTGFGSAVAAVDGPQSAYVVVGAPLANGGRGRAFVYKKPNGSGSFEPPVELSSSNQPGNVPPTRWTFPTLELQPGDHFGATLSMRLGMIVVGAPGQINRDSGVFGTFSAYTYFQPSDSQPFARDAGLGGPSISLPYAEQVLLSKRADGPLFVCGHWRENTFYGALRVSCQEYYAFSLAGEPAHWSPMDGWLDADSAAVALSPSSLAVHHTDNTLEVFNGRVGLHYCSSGQLCEYDPYFSFQYPANHIFGVPGGLGTFTGGPAGTNNLFLVGVTVPGSSSTQLYGFAPTDAALSPVQNLSAPQMGRTMASNGNYWLVSNTDAAGGGSAGGAVFRLKRNPGAGGSWTPDALGTGNNTFGASLALTSSFGVIGDPNFSQVVLVDNDQALLNETFPSPSGKFTVNMTFVQGSPPPTIEEDPSCAALPPNVFQGVFSNAPCVHVTSNAPLVGDAKVCFPNPNNHYAATILRCTSPNATAQCLQTQLDADCCTGRDALIGGQCCLSLDSPNHQANPICASTPHFSTLAVGILTDTDRDFVPDVDDNCRSVQNPQQLDADQDGVGDACDNCLSSLNPDQADNDHDGIGNVCDPTPGIAVAAPMPPAALPLLAFLLLGFAVHVLRRRGEQEVGIQS